MLVCRAGNKGAVCLPFRFHQSTLVVAAAHLPADGSRGSKVCACNSYMYGYICEWCFQLSGR